MMPETRLSWSISPEAVVLSTDILDRLRLAAPEVACLLREYLIAD